MAPKSFFWYPTGFQEYLYILNLWLQQQQQQQSSFIYGITSFYNALPVSRLHNKSFRDTTLMLKIYLYIKKIYPIINYTKINQPLLYII